MIDASTYFTRFSFTGPAGTLRIRAPAGMSLQLWTGPVIPLHYNSAIHRWPAHCTYLCDLYCSLEQDRTSTSSSHRNQPRDTPTKRVISAMVREVVTLQLGELSNYVATHFWNTQVRNPPAPVELWWGRGSSLHASYIPCFGSPG